MGVRVSVPAAGDSRPLPSIAGWLSRLVAAGLMLLAFVVVALVAIAASPILFESAELTASDAASNDRFGRSVSIHGDTIAVGADGVEGATGGAYIFTRTDTGWGEQAKLVASDGEKADDFGWSISVDEDTVVVGAPDGPSSAGSDTGSAYTYQRVGGDWEQGPTLVASDGVNQDNFGWSVAVDGDTIVVGSRSDGDAGQASGAAYVFVRSGENWTEQAKLTASDADSFYAFGRSLAIQGDTIVVGASGADTLTGSHRGAAYVFVRSGETWAEQAKLAASDGASTFDDFGWSIDLDGSQAVVGAPGGRNEDGTRVGAAYIYENTGGQWSEVTKLLASDGENLDEFGISVAIAGDSVIVGAESDDDSGALAGAGYHFVGVDNIWTEEAKLLASNGQGLDHLGFAVDADQSTAVVGAYSAAPSGSTGGMWGSTYVFDVSVAEPPVVDPVVSVDPTSGVPGTEFAVVGSGFTEDPMATVTSNLQRPDGSEFDPIVIATDGSGGYTTPIDSAGFEPGTWTTWATDDTTGTESNHATFEVAPTSVSVILEPGSAMLEVGETHTITATVALDELFVEGTTVEFVVTGAHDVASSTTTDSAGVASLSYGGTDEGTDTVVAVAIVDGLRFGSQPATVEWRGGTLPPLIVIVQGINSEWHCEEDWEDPSAAAVNQARVDSVVSSIRIQVPDADYRVFSYSDHYKECDDGTTQADYSPIFTCGTIDQAGSSLRFQLWLAEVSEGRPAVHVVAHSMGGVVVSYALSDWPGGIPSNIGSVVTLDSPLTGSGDIRRFIGVNKFECTFSDDALKDLGKRSGVINAIMGSGLADEEPHLRYITSVANNQDRAVPPSDSSLPGAWLNLRIDDRCPFDPGEHHCVWTNNRALEAISASVEVPVISSGPRGSHSIEGGDCQGRPANVIGSDEDDSLSGGPGADVMVGGDGVDSIYGGEGDDLICGGDRVDYLFGEGDDDYLYGGNGNDTLQGGPDNDHMFGEWGDRDNLTDGSGEDHFDGGDGDKDKCDGLGDDDVFIGCERPRKVFG